MRENRIIRIYNIIKNRLPEKYIFPIKIIKNTKAILKYVSKKTGRNYNELIKSYNIYLQNPKTATYTKTKYWIRGRKNAFDISAMSGNPILISKERVINRPEYEIAYLILHEIKHNLQNKKSEKRADSFAIRWVRKLINEKLIKGIRNENPKKNL